MRDHLVLGLGFVLIAINARAADPAPGGLEGIREHMEKSAPAQTAQMPAPRPEATPKRKQASHAPGTGKQAGQSNNAVVADPKRRAEMAGKPVAPGGLESIKQTQEAKGALTFKAKPVPPANPHPTETQKDIRLDDRLK